MLEEPTDTDNATGSGSNEGDEDTNVGGDATTDTSEEDSTDSTDQETDDAASDEDEEESETEDNEAEWDDDTVDAVWDAYRDRFLDRKDIKKQMDRSIQQQVEEQLAKRQRALEVEDIQERAATQGRTSVDKLKRQIDSVVAELKKAADGEEDFDASVLDIQEYGQNLQSFGRSIADEVSTRYDSALKDSIEQALTDAIPELTEDQVEEFDRILTVAERMEGDRKQYSQAKHYFVGGMLNFLIERAKEAGSLEERNRQQSKGKVSKKIADSNAVKVAQAKLAGRKKAPPTAPKSKPGARPAAGKAWDSDYYRGLKREGNHKEAQDYADAYLKTGGR